METKRNHKRRRTQRVALDLRRLSGREELWRFPSARRRDPAVEAWFAEGAIELRSIAREWFEEMRRCGADVRELIHDGCPVACAGDAAFAYVNAFKAHVNVGFFYGASLDDPADLLEGGGKRMRHVKLTPDTEPNAKALRALVKAAYEDIRARLEERT
jgi:hypothetical protein